MTVLCLMVTVVSVGFGQDHANKLGFYIIQRHLELDGFIQALTWDQHPTPLHTFHHQSCNKNTRLHNPMWTSGPPPPKPSCCS